MAYPTRKKLKEIFDADNINGVQLCASYKGSINDRVIITSYSDIKTEDEIINFFEKHNIRIEEIRLLNPPLTGYVKFKK